MISSYFFVALPSASLTSLRLAVYNTLSRKEVEKLCFDYGFFPSWIPNIENFPCTSNVAYLQIFTFKQIWPCFTKDLMITSTFWENIFRFFEEFKIRFFKASIQFDQPALKKMFFKSPRIATKSWLCKKHSMFKPSNFEKKNTS